MEALRLELLWAGEVGGGHAAGFVEDPSRGNIDCGEVGGPGGEVGEGAAQDEPRKAPVLAEEWLRTTDRPVTDIAVDLGFSSSQHFARAFRRHTGAAPVSLRRAAGGRNPAAISPDFSRPV